MALTGRSVVIYLTAMLWLIKIDTAEAEPIAVSSQSIGLYSLSQDQPGREIGCLSFVGGLKLTSSDPRFGGLSGMSIGKDGQSLAMVTDRGHLIRARLRQNSAGLPLGLEDVTLVPLLSDDLMASKKSSDAESIARLADGRFVVSFERHHRLELYDQNWRPLGSYPNSPKALEKLSKNGGLEAIEAMADGSLLIIAEGKDQADHTKAWVLRGKQAQKIEFPLSDGFRPTGLTRLPGGDMVLLERFFSPLLGAKSRLRRIAIDQNGLPNLPGTVVATLEAPVRVDNYEGIAAFQTPSGQILIYILSDDNFSVLQDTLLMVFAWSCE